jgi:hypothetical protein
MKHLKSTKLRPPKRKPMRSNTVTDKQPNPSQSVFEEIYRLQGTLGEFPLEADLEAEHRKERRRENEREGLKKVRPLSRMENRR